ncbi:hypothetical protein SY88_19145 [Clostridiales bacterium PH28_bin88]|nr:hypothetical protein SY88_19145 [Clostridiales bacterium PH28_bin88]
MDDKIKQLLKRREALVSLWMHSRSGKTELLVSIMDLDEEIGELIRRKRSLKVAVSMIRPSL